MLNPLALPFIPTQHLDTPYEPQPNQNDLHIDVKREKIEKRDMRTSYDHMIEKIAILTSMFPGSEVPGLVSSYLCWDLKGIIERNRASILSAAPSYFHINFINQLVKNCRYVNDDQGRFMWNSSMVYQYFAITEEDGDGDGDGDGDVDDDMSLELKTKLKSIWLGPMRFCTKSGEYADHCGCSVCNDGENYLIVFSDSDEEADINF